jgi:ketosteroid isomerase-like protein
MFMSQNIVPRVASALACGALAALLLTSCTTVPRADTRTAAREVADTERAFAKTMSDRDLAAFSNFIAPDAVFFSGPEPRRGKQAVVEFWKRFYDKPEAPFSWRPETVEVLDSGTLALSSGPVFDPTGKQIATFTSIWRLEASGTWRIVFDKGNSVCDCAKTPLVATR